MPAKVKLNFTDSNLGINAGCNNGGGDYKVKDGVLIIDSMAQTEMYCEGLMEQELGPTGQALQAPGPAVTTPTSTWSREDGMVVGGWRWFQASGAPQLLLFLGPYPDLAARGGSSSSTATSAPSRAAR